MKPKRRRYKRRWYVRVRWRRLKVKPETDPNTTRDLFEDD